MKAIILSFIFLFIISSPLFSQVPIQYYDFENNTTRATGEQSAEFIVNPISGSTISSSGGVLSSVSGNPSSGSAQQRANWNTLAGDPGTITTSYIEFKVNSSGFSGISVGVDVISSSLLLDNAALIYSTDGTNFSSAGIKSLTMSWATVNWDLSAVSSLDNVSSITFRLYAFGTAATSGTETLTIDNLTIYANTVTATKTLPNYQTIDDANGAAPFPTFTNFTVNGSGITATLSGDLQIGGTMTLTNGIIATGSNIVKIDSSASISGAGSSSYIYGNLKRIFPYNTTPFTETFPIGSASAFREIDVTIFSQTSAGSITAKVTDGNPGYTLLPSGVTSISTVRYWTVTIGDGLTFDANGTYGIKLFWGADDGITDSSTITVVRGTAGGSWTEKSNTGSSGTNKWVFGSFSNPTNNDFTFGDTGINALPVEIYSFASEIVNERNVLLKWSTATEVNTYKFEIERKAAAQNKTSNSWEKISEISANGNSNSTKSYSYEDKNLEAGDYQYRLKTIDLNGSFSYSNSAFAKISAPEKFVLRQNYPNPFNPATNISYSLPADGNVTLKIYDAIGREVSTLVSTFQKAGHHNLKFDASQFSSGIYFYRMIYSSTDSRNNYTDIKKMILVR